MRRMRTGLVVLVVALATLGGCAHDEHLKAPKVDPEYILPPRDSPQFNSYHKYPDNTLNVFPKKERKTDEFELPNSSMPGRMPRSGMGGPGR